MFALQPESPRPVGNGGIRRRRLVLSCLVCKRKKIKCDRGTPVCTKCVDSGHSSQCTYDKQHVARVSSYRSDPRHEPSLVLSDPIPEPSGVREETAIPITGVSTTTTPEARRIDDLERHIAHLEAKLRHATEASDDILTTGAAQAPPNLARQHVDTTPSLISGVGFKTQFHGATHCAGILTYFDGLRGFLKKTASEHPVIGKQAHTAQGKFDGRLPLLPIAPQDLDDAIRQSIPGERRCRQLMMSYFKHFEGIFRVIHSVNFWRRYKDYWSNQQTPDTTFSMLMLAAMSCARCVSIDGPILFDGDSSEARCEAVRWVHVIETWHDKQSQKHTTLEVFQVRCLLLISKKINVIKMKRVYTLAHSLLAGAIAIGLHKSPVNMNVKTSVYESEMRRRIWATICEIESIESIDRGVPSLMSSLHSDVEPPANWLDDDFDEYTIIEPQSRPADEFTPSTLARYAHELRPLRRTIIDLVNDTDRHKRLTPAELHLLHDRIVDRFKDVSSWPKQTSIEEHQELAFLCKVRIETQLHEMLILLHLPFALSASADATTSHSLFVCRNSAGSVIDSFTRLQDHGFNQKSLPRGDIVRATLCLCLVQSPSVTHGNSVYPNFNTPATTIDLLEKSFNLMEQRILALGDGFRGFWILFAASCFITPHKDPIVSAAWQEKVITRIIMLCRRISVSQVNRDPNGDVADKLFARYMEHILGSSKYADFGAGGVTLSAAQESSMLIPHIGGLDFFSDPFDESGGWLDTTMDDFGFYGLTGI